jgi:hypothetical protein
MRLGKGAAGLQGVMYGLKSLRENSILEGHGFSRASLTGVLEGFSP